MSESRFQVLAGRFSRFAGGRSSQPADAEDACTLAGVIGRIPKASDGMADTMDPASALDRQLLHEGLIANSPDAMISTTLQGIVTSWNPAAWEIYDYTETEIKNRTLALVIPDDQWDKQLRIFEKIGRGERIKNNLATRRRRNGELFSVAITISPMRNRQGQIIGVFEIARDITEDLKAAEALKLIALGHEEKMKKSSQELDEFAYTAAHDLKAPLRVIDSIAHWLLEDLEPHFTRETRENMSLLRNRVKQMEKLLGDLLEYSCIGRRQDERFREAVNGDDLLENILELLSPPAGFVVMSDTGFREITVLRMPLQQVLMNLIGNAIKHHDKPEGSVKLGLRDAGAMVEFTVEDDGPGIPEQFHEKIFEMFRTLKPRDQVEGNGLGLAMVRKRVEMSGGVIILQSAPGQGSRFIFTWPKFQPVRTMDS